MDDWDDILQQLDSDDDERPSKRPRVVEGSAGDEPARVDPVGQEDASGPGPSADSVDDAKLEGEHGEVRAEPVRAPAQPTKEEVEEHRRKWRKQKESGKWMRERGGNWKPHGKR